MPDIYDLTFNDFLWRARKINGERRNTIRLVLEYKNHEAELQWNRFLITHSYPRETLAFQELYEELATGGGRLRTGFTIRNQILYQD